MNKKVPFERIKQQCEAAVMRHTSVLELNQAFEAAGLKSRAILFVHDSITLNVPQGEQEKVIEIVGQVMDILPKGRRRAYGYEELYGSNKSGY